MRNLTINDLKLAISDLLDVNKPRFSALSMTKSWGFYGDSLRQKHHELMALPSEVVGATRQSTESLTEADHSHDGFGSALFFHTESYLRAPDTSKELKAIVLELRDQFIGSLGELKASYSDEATRAKERQPKIEQYKSKLQMFPLVGGKTLYDWAKHFIEDGLKLADILSQRAYTEARLTDPAKSTAASLRVETVSVLTNIRSLLTQERQQNASLPANLDALLFGLFDELQQKRHAATAPTLPFVPSLPPEEPKS